MRLYIRTIESYADSDTSLFEAARRKRLERITNPKVRSECIAAGAALREALADYGYPVGDEPLKISYDKHGKPSLETEKSLKAADKGPLTAPYFSISHSGDIVVVAVDDEPVGADVQVVKKVSGRLPGRVLSETELSEYNSIAGTKTEEEARVYFTVRWTEKESIAKLNGKGIGMDFRTIEPGNYRMHTVFRAIEGTEYVITTAQHKQ